MKIMGLDYGSVTVGVAISDSMLLTAQPVEVIKRKSENKLRQTLARIQVLAEENDVGRIVLGYPKNMNNSEGERVERTKEFMEKLKARTGLEVVLWDERLSTVSAMDVLKEGWLPPRHAVPYRAYGIRRWQTAGHHSPDFCPEILTDIHPKVRMPTDKSWYLLRGSVSVRC